MSTQSGGTNTISGSLILGQNATSGGTYNLNGGLLSLAGLAQGSGSAAFSFSGGTFQAMSSFSTSLAIVLTTRGDNGLFDTNGNALTLTGNLSGSGGLTMVGSGAVTLSGSNSYASGTTISAGNLAFSSTSAIPGTGTVTIGNSGALVATPLYNANAPVSGWLSSGKIAANSSGAIALPNGTSDTETIALSSTSSGLSLGAIGSATFGGTLTTGGWSETR